MKKVRILVSDNNEDLELAINSYIAQMSESAKVASDGNVEFNVVDIKYTPATDVSQCSAMVIYTHSL